MRVAKLQVVTLAVLLVGWCTVPSTPAQADSKQHTATKPSRAKSKDKRPAPQVQQPEPDPLPPLPPPTPEEMPSTPPTVTYQNSQLTIVARNSTLADILDAVRNKTGAEFDVPDTADERVVGRFGPGPARDVLAKLLNGSHFNYVMVGTVADPNSVAHVILTAKTGGVTPPMPGGQPPSFQQAVLPSTQPQQISSPQPYPQQMQGAAEPADDDQAATDDSSDAADDTGDQEAEQTQNPGQPTIKSPEELLQELQRRQQLLQQQQMQQQGQPQQLLPGQRPQLIYSNPPQEKPEQ